MIPWAFIWPGVEARGISGTQRLRLLLHPFTRIVLVLPAALSLAEPRAGLAGPGRPGISPAARRTSPISCRASLFRALKIFWERPDETGMSRSKIPAMRG